MKKKIKTNILYRLYILLCSVDYIIDSVIEGKEKEKEKGRRRRLVGKEV